MKFTSENHEIVHTGIVAQSCVVDMEGGNIFFVEGEDRNIQAISTNPVRDYLYES